MTAGSMGKLAAAGMRESPETPTCINCFDNRHRDRYQLQCYDSNSAELTTLTTNFQEQLKRTCFVLRFAAFSKISSVSLSFKWLFLWQHLLHHKHLRRRHHNCIHRMALGNIPNLTRLRAVSTQQRSMRAMSGPSLRTLVFLLLRFLQMQSPQK